MILALLPLNSQCNLVLSGGKNESVDQVADFVKCNLVLPQLEKKLNDLVIRSQIAIPAQGLIEFRDALTGLLIGRHCHLNFIFVDVSGKIFVFLDP